MRLRFAEKKTDDKNACIDTPNPAETTVDALLFAVFDSALVAETLDVAVYRAVPVGTRTVIVIVAVAPTARSPMVQTLVVESNPVPVDET